MIVEFAYFSHIFILFPIARGSKGRRRSCSGTSTRCMGCSFGSSMTSQCISTCKGLVTKWAGIKFDTEMKLCMSISVVLPWKPFRTIITSVGSFCAVCASVGLQTVRPRKRLLAARIVAMVRRIGFLLLLLLLRTRVVVVPRLSSSGCQV